MDENKKLLIEFTTNDFNDTSEKLELTDKKIQFTIQIYGLVIGALLTFLMPFILPSNSNVTRTYNEKILVSLGVFFAILMGEFIYYYIILGQCIHVIYLNRMNMLRKSVYIQLDQFSDIKKKYIFTNKVENKKGMNFSMICFLTVLVCFLCLLFGYCTWYTTNNAILSTVICSILIFTVIRINIILFVYYVTEKAKKDIERMWTDFDGCENRSN